MRYQVELLLFQSTGASGSWRQPYCTSARRHRADFGEWGWWWPQPNPHAWMPSLTCWRLPSRTASP